MLEKNLEKLGFSPSEIKVYLRLLRHGSSYANRISSETGINRTNVYEALDRLVAKGVVSFITRNRVKWFEAKSVDSLKALVDEKEAEFKKTQESFLRDISGLKKSLPAGRTGLEAGVFVGKKGLRMLFEEMLETCKPLCFLASELQFKSFFGAYFEQWHKKRIRKGIRQRSIFPKKMKGLLKKRKLLEYRFIGDEYASPTATIIYGDTCLLIQWSNPPLAIKIQNKEIAKSHRNYFNMLWAGKG